MSVLNAGLPNRFGGSQKKAKKEIDPRKKDAILTKKYRKGVYIDNKEVLSNVLLNPDSTLELRESGNNSDGTEFMMVMVNNMVDGCIQHPFQKWGEWTIDTFPKSTASSSLDHLERELKELRAEIAREEGGAGIRKALLAEYADCINCLITSAMKMGIEWKELFEGMIAKQQVNYERKWHDNGDGTYSHIK